MGHLTATSHVMRSAVQSYYASIDHCLVYQQVCAVIPDQRLHALLWDYLRCTVCDGGNYREVRRGISRSSPLSPLLGALSLTPLDEAIATLPVRYVRYMDDWVVIASSRWQLRQAIRVVNQQLARLHLRQHPDKTWIGRAQRGFDFLAYHLMPGRLSPALKTLHHCLVRMSQLYEYGAGMPRIGLYLQHWSRWVTAGGGWFGDVFRPCGSGRRPVPRPMTHQLLGLHAITE